MYIYIYVYVHIYVYTCVHKYVCSYMYMNTSTLAEKYSKNRAYIHGYIYTQLHSHVIDCACAYVHVFCVDMCICVCVCMCMHVCVCAYKCLRREYSTQHHPYIGRRRGIVCLIGKIPFPQKGHIFGSIFVPKRPVISGSFAEN